MLEYKDEKPKEVWLNDKDLKTLAALGIRTRVPKDWVAIKITPEKEKK